MLRERLNVRPRLGRASRRIAHVRQHLPADLPCGRVPPHIRASPTCPQRPPTPALSSLSPGRRPPQRQGRARQHGPASSRGGRPHRLHQSSDRQQGGSGCARSRRLHAAAPRGCQWCVQTWARGDSLAAHLVRCPLQATLSWSCEGLTAPLRPNNSPQPPPTAPPHRTRRGVCRSAGRRRLS